MKDFYFYCFYVLAKFCKWAKVSEPEFSGMAYLSVLMSFNIFSLASIVELSGGFQLRSAISFMVIMAGVLGLNYYLVISVARNKVIIQSFSNRTTTKAYKVIFFIYLVGSVGVFCWTSYLVRQARS
ncbi:MAG: hypothetical protein JWP27_1266 [Flaviaesturariibacter sp.]|nr:hypothetical protein [Flaviaesturariibacter sp.]